jgi:hypothetical protein
MPSNERERTPAPQALTSEYLEQRRQEGWRLVALEWERPAAAGAGGLVEVPYGWKVAPDCRHLEENPAEQQALLVMMDGIVADRSLSEVAAELNARGLATRLGMPWSAPAIFELLPRLVETGPRMFGSEAWLARRGAVAR